jgi:hypothetical protein
MFESSLGLACKERDTEIHCIFELRWNFRQHRQTPRNVKATNENLNARRAQRARDIHRPRKLI